MSLDPQTQRLYATDDAMVWAEEWCKVARGIYAATGDDRQLIDAGWMVGWFANAMQIGIQHSDRRAWEKLRPMLYALRLELPGTVWDDVDRRIREALHQPSAEIEAMIREGA